MVLVIETHRACPLAGPHNGYEASRGVSSLQLGRCQARLHRKEEEPPDMINLTKNVPFRYPHHCGIRTIPAALLTVTRRRTHLMVVHVRRSPPCSGRTLSPAPYLISGRIPGLGTLRTSLRTACRRDLFSTIVGSDPHSRLGFVVGRALHGLGEQPFSVNLSDESVVQYMAPPAREDAVIASYRRSGRLSPSLRVHGRIPARCFCGNDFWISNTIEDSRKSAGGRTHHYSGEGSLVAGWSAQEVPASR